MGSTILNYRPVEMKKILGGGGGGGGGWEKQLKLEKEGLGGGVQ